MEMLKKLVKDEHGQGSTEYMVLLASVIAALVGAAYFLKEPFEAGVKKLGGNVKESLNAGFVQTN